MLTFMIFYQYFFIVPSLKKFFQETNETDYVHTGQLNMWLYVQHGIDSSL